MKTHLLSEIEKNTQVFKNRIVMAPMTRSRAIQNLPNDLMQQYYAQRSTAGLIITEGVAPSPNALGYARIPGIFNNEQAIGWKKITEAVHADGGKIFIQLMHVGRIANKANMPENTKILAPSAVNAHMDMWTDTLGMQKTEEPLEMSLEEIEKAKGEFIQAAKNAIEAGFDGVELHAANGYLLEQFLNPNSNIRNDKYGGSIENRSRFVLEVTEAVGHAIGFDKIGVRISPYSTFNTMALYKEIPETYIHVVTELAKLDITYLHVIDYAARATEEGRNLIKTIRKEFGQLLILNGGYTKERAENVLINNDADLISFGSPFIANPDLPYRIENNIEWAKADPATFYTADEKGYIDYSDYNI
ncbi:alkene reductase [Elizabethkingia anophelis]|uniref:alkene reductase n=2 Tax=Elizabethkingia anophelis TaxID=1117645 RepID=UPI00040CB0EF|nr:alkene reductase [Elizabethkingia anophelis]MCT3745105.1 alkene reductase [Elizabethkingia anophelis]MCT3834770.1 alkene reductase [Elizabethkingia anophelis]MCT3977942.1 alkene reductase [Elizabethkingia anophelis]MCT4041816.1 alkene reductase [Elizabethkingia anophelis]MCT4172569.1 alkene reductase [Elizabethkingia anophelis]